MTRAEKILKRKNRSALRLQDRLTELDRIKVTMELYGYSFRSARCFVRHGYRPYSCEVGYSDCEARGYCNGDC